MTGTDTRLAATAAAYDAASARYAEFTGRGVDEPPLDRAVLAAFAEHVTAAGGGLVADAGCGPGRIGAHLAGLGLDVMGVDVSPAMIAIARAWYPALRFTTASMDALPLPDSALAGLAAAAGLAEVGRMSREPGGNERFRRGHLLLRRA